MIIWRVNKTFNDGLGIKVCKGHYLITANYRERFYKKNRPVEEIGRFQCYWGARPCVVHLTQKEAEKWIKEINNNSRKIRKRIIGDRR